MSTTIPAAVGAPLLGFRCWAVARRGLLSRTLASSAAESLWSGVDVEACCYKSHAAPQMGCTCGIHAFDSLDSALWYARTRHGRLRSWLAGEEVVVGAVQLWGADDRKVLVGELEDRPGYQYRAPRARIVALADSEAARRVAADLGVPIVSQDYLESYAREVGGAQLRPASEAQPTPDRWAQPLLSLIPSPPIPHLDRRSVAYAAMWTLGFIGRLTVNAIALSLLAIWWALRLELKLVRLGWRFGGPAGAVIGVAIGVAVPAIVLVGLRFRL